MGSEQSNATREAPFFRSTETQQCPSDSFIATTKLARGPLGKSLRAPAIFCVVSLFHMRFFLATVLGITPRAKPSKDPRNRETRGTAMRFM